MKIMKYALPILLIGLAFGVVIGRAGAPVTFTSNSTITMATGISTVDQASADANKAANLLSFAKAHQLDVYTDATRTVVDATKVAPAVVAYYKADFKQTVQEFNAKAAADTAATAQRAVDSALNP
jgi:hypothetical protein